MNWGQKCTRGLAQAISIRFVTSIGIKNQTKKKHTPPSQLSDNTAQYFYFNVLSAFCDILIVHLLFVCDVIIVTCVNGLEILFY